MLLGNLRWEHTAFNSRLQPTQIGLGTSSTDSSLLKLDYNYGSTNNNGNVLTQTITAPKAATGSLLLSQSYTYDALNRLLTATENGGASWQQTYDIDRWGNRAVRNTSYMPSPQLTPQSASQTDFSAFNQSTNRLSQTKYPSLLYDGAGNLTRDMVSSTFAYDGENRQITSSVAGVSATYTYDGDGRRVKKVVGNTTTVFVYNVNGQLIAEYTSDPVPPPAGGGGTSYLTSDTLGSTRVVTKADGSVKARYDYLPFGEEIASSIGGRGGVAGYGGADSTRQKFTSKERDTESGLDYFGARYYSSLQGRFTSPDEFTGGPDDLFDFADNATSNPTFYADLHNPQSLNKYHYGYNNPLRYVDPDGHDPGDDHSNEGFFSAALSFAKGVGQGAVDTVVGTATGVKDLVTHPIDTVKSAAKEIGGILKADYDIITHPGQAAGAIADAARELGPNETARIIGHTTGTVVTSVAISKGIKALGRMAKVGGEIKINNNIRIAPFGNRTGHPIGRWPHYHRRGAAGPKGNTPPGQGIGRHRPWERKTPDKSFWDRF